MEYGCLKDKRFAIDGGNLSDFSDQTQVRMYEKSFLVRREVGFWEITTDPETMPLNLNLVCDRNPGFQRRWQFMAVDWVEYGLNQKMNWDGQTSLTKYQDIEKWWEIVCTYYSLACLPTQINSEKVAHYLGSRVRELARTSRMDEEGTGWKNWRGIFD